MLVISIKIVKEVIMRYPTLIKEVSSSYGMRNGSFHDGVDFPTPMYSDHIIVADGIVKKLGFDSDGYGYYMVIEHDGFCSLYAHQFQRAPLNVGDAVKGGQHISAISGNSGSSTGAHTHFEIRECRYSEFWTLDEEIPSKFKYTIDPMEVISEDMTLAEAVEILKTEVGLEDDTIQFMLYYRYGTELVIKLATAVQ